MKAFMLMLYLLTGLSNHLPAQTLLKDTLQARVWLQKAEDFTKKNLLDSAVVYLDKSSLVYRTYDLWSNYFEVEKKIGYVYYAKLRKYDLSIFRLKEVLSISKKLKNKDQYTANFLVEIGIAFSGKKLRDSSITYFKNALMIRKKIFGDKAFELAEIYEHIGIAHFFKAEYREATTYFKLVLKLFETHNQKNPLKQAKMHHNIAVAQMTLGDYEQAVIYASNALAIRIQELGENHIETATNYAILASIFQQKNGYNLALEYDQKALDIFLKNNKPEYLLQQYSNIGTSYANLEQYDTAIDFHNKAFQLAKKLNLDSLDITFGYIYNNLGYGYFQKGNLINANKNYLNSLRVLKHNLDYYTIGEVYNNLGKIKRLLNNDLDSAKYYYQQAIQIHSNIFGQKSATLPIFYNNLADLYNIENNPIEALKYFQSAIKANLPLDYDSDKGIEYFEAKISILNRLELLNSLFYTAHTLKNRKEGGDNNLKKAIQTIQVSDILINQSKNATLNIKDKLIIAQKSENLYNEGLEISWLMKPSDSLLHLAFYFSERKKANILYNAIQEARAKSYAGIPDSLVERERVLKVDIAYYEKSLAEQPDSSTQAYLRERLFSTNRQYEALVGRFEKEFPQYYRLKYQSKTITIPQIQAQLSPQTTLLEYALGEKHLFVFVIDKQKFVWRAIPIDTSFQTKIVNYNRNLRKNRQTELRIEAYFLYQKLIAPIQDLLLNKKHLYIIPDGILSILPFETLLTQPVNPTLTDWSKFPFLLRRFEFSYYPSATLAFDNLPTTSKSITYEGDWLGFAPVFLESNAHGQILEVNRQIEQDRKLPPLKHSETEVKEILKLFSGKSKVSRAYLHQLANEENLKKEIGKYRFVHIATHSKGNEDNMQLAYIAFTQPDSSLFVQSLKAADTSVEDGILYAGEIFALQVNAELLVLSSCETGIGRLAKGEGILSILRAFNYAGAQKIVYSLWQLNDEPTATLMVEFYKQILQKNLNYRTALHQAKIKLSQDSRLASPRNWGGVVLMGE
jgi:CHAT domain-containing protein/tetratricopeptide (TPR) repeat protein